MRIFPDYAHAENLCFFVFITCCKPEFSVYLGISVLATLPFAAPCLSVRVIGTRNCNFNFESRTPILPIYVREICFTNRSFDVLQSLRTTIYRSCSWTKNFGFGNSEIIVTLLNEFNLI